jgi:hypothetical protein
MSYRRRLHRRQYLRRSRRPRPEYGGNGIAFSVIAAEIIRDYFLGRTNRDAHLFRFGR